MPTIYAVHEGGGIRIGTWGTATVTAPVVVPEEVARELETHPGLRVERELELSYVQPMTATDDEAEE